MEDIEVIKLIKDLSKDEKEKEIFLCYLLLIKTYKEFDACKKALDKLLKDE